MGRRAFLGTLLGLLFAPVVASQQWLASGNLTIFKKQGMWCITGHRASLKAVQDAVADVVTNYSKSNSKPTILIDGIDIYE